jgi:hypothetical protein
MNRSNLNKTIFIPTFNKLCTYLSKKNYTYKNNNYICNKKFAVMHYNINNTNIIRIWKTYSFYNFWYTDFLQSDNQDNIASFDYIIQDDAIKLDFMCINDESLQYEFRENKYLTEKESAQISKSIINYIEQIAHDNNKKIIRIDVHENLNTYFKYYYKEGFKLTHQKCKDNSIWIIAEKELIHNKN